MHRGTIHINHPDIQQTLFPNEGTPTLPTWTTFYYQLHNKCRCDACKESYQQEGNIYKPVKPILNLLASALNSVKKVAGGGKKTPSSVPVDARRELTFDGTERPSTSGTQPQHSPQATKPAAVAGGGGVDGESVTEVAHEDQGDQEGNGEGNGGGRGNDDRGDDQNNEGAENNAQNHQHPQHAGQQGGRGNPGDSSDPSSDPSSDEDDDGDRGRRRRRDGQHRRGHGRERQRGSPARELRTPSPPRRQVAPVVQPIITQAALTLKGEGCPIFDGNVYSYQKWRPLVVAVMKTGYVPNARMHSQLLDRLGPTPLALVDSIDMDEESSAYRILDALDDEYNKPWLANQLLIEQLYQLPNYVFNLSSTKEVVQSRQYVMHLMKIRSAMKHAPDAHADLKTLMNKIMLKLNKKLIVRWEDKCQETAQSKHAALYEGTRQDYFRQNQKFPNERFDDLITVLEEHIVKSKSIVDRVGRDGYLNPDNVASSAQEAMNYQQKRLEAMQGGRNRNNNQQTQQSSTTVNQQQQRNNNNSGNRGQRKTYATVAATPAPPATNATTPTVAAAVQATQQGKPPQKPQGNNTTTGTSRGPPPGVPQVWQKTCFICGAKNEHWPAQCKNPNNRSANSILKSCIKAKVCFNCLRENTDHRSRACPHGSCQVDGCMEKHHTLLHNAEWKRMAELQEEAKNELEKKAQVKATKLEAQQTPTPVNATNQSSTNANRGGGNRGNRRRKRQAPSAPNTTNSTSIQPAAAVVGSTSVQHRA